jgi:hypothetical protein
MSLKLFCNGLHLDQESLELAEGTGIMLFLDCGSGHDGCNVGEDIAHRGVEDETIDWLVEGLRTEEGDGNKGTSCQGQDRPNSFERAEVSQLLLGDVFGQHGGGFVGELME